MILRGALIHTQLHCVLMGNARSKKSLYCNNVCPAHSIYSRMQGKGVG